MFELAGRKRTKTNTEKSRLIALAIAALATVSACSDSTPGTYQGYVEGEFVHVGSGVAGRLERLFVAARTGRGGQRARCSSWKRTRRPRPSRRRTKRSRAAKAQLADLGTGKRRSEVEVARAQLEQATAAEKQSASQLARDTAPARGRRHLARCSSRRLAPSTTSTPRACASSGASSRWPSSRPGPEQVRAQSSQVAAARAAADQTRWRLEPDARRGDAGRRRRRHPLPRRGMGARRLSGRPDAPTGERQGPVLRACSLAQSRADRAQA